MITNLRIKNVALIDEVEVLFGGGLNILSGETGAGKSIIIDSINFLLGERPGKDFVRNGADCAVVEGLIELTDDAVLSAVTAMGFDMADDGQLLIQRTFYAQGKSSCRINGKTVTVGMLKELSALLVDVHGQHEHQSLLNTSKQINLLDQFCGEPLSTLKLALERLLQQYRENKKALQAVMGLGGQRETQLEIWQYQIDEIAKARLSAGEEEALLLKRGRLNGLDKLSQYTTEALALLDGGEMSDSSACDQAGRAMSLLLEIGKLDPAREALAETLSEAVSLLSDAAGELRAYQEELDADPMELERVEARLDVIYRLKKKYGSSVADILAHYEKTVAQMEQLQNSEAELKRLNAEKRKLVGEISELCKQMSKIRKQQASGIRERILAVLHDLGMEHAQFDIVVESKEVFGPNGNDVVEFMISPNKGEPLKSLSKIASGGEMSRVMLALKTVMADADRIGTLIFDEIDTGVSGRTAQQVAEKLTGISRGRQILCITHLPQIAAMADVHFLIEKKTVGEKTVTSVREQTEQEMIQELARLIGGAQITDATLKAAKEMKQMAEQLKTR